MTALTAHVTTEINPLELVPLLTMGGGYFYRAHQLASRGRPVPIARQLTFLAGLLAFAAAIASPLSHLNEELFSAHTVQHLLITDVSALLIVIGLTGPVMQPVLRIPVLRWTRTFSNPAVALPLWVVNLYIWHLPALYQLALGSYLVHGAQHALFFGISVALWMPLFGPLPRPEWFGDLAQFLYVVGFRFGGVILGNALIWSGLSIYGDYADGAAEWGISPVADQGVGGAIMGVENIIFSLCLVAWLMLRFAKHDEAAQRLVDQALDLGIELDKRRARRAIAAGYEERLRARLERGATESSRNSGAQVPGVPSLAASGNDVPDRAE